MRGGSVTGGWRGIIGSMLGRDDREMPFLEHLEELRRVIIRGIGILLVATFAAYYFSGRLLEWIVVRTVGEAMFLRPMEAFNARLKIAFLLGSVVSIPFILWQIWAFVVPGLMRKERKMIGPLVFWSTLLFYAGIVFSYLVVTPMMLQFLIGMGTEHIRAQIAVSYLLDFVIGMALASGVLFQLPVVVAILSMVEILRPEFLIRQWRHAVVGTFILTAVVTPGDVFVAQIVLAVPVLILYFSSIFVARAIWRGKERSPDTPAGHGDGGTQHAG
jgi:sec-independent protein translocase protein TatC